MGVPERDICWGIYKRVVEMGAPKKLPGFVRRKRPYRITRVPRKCIQLYEPTYNALEDKKRPDETWDQFMRRIQKILF